MLVLGIGGTLRPGSSSETALRVALDAAAEMGAQVECFSGTRLDLPLFNPADSTRIEHAKGLVAAARAADGVIISSPGYHGTISGSVKNALDYIEDMRADARPYFDMLPVGCIAVAYGWQAAVNTLRTVRDVTHALRGFPTPFGAAVNSSGGTFEGGRCVDADVVVTLERVGQQVVRLGGR